MSLFDSAWMSEPGGESEGNEDSVAADADMGLFVVADGMGGQAGGARASRAAVDAFLGHLAGLTAPQRVEPACLREAVERCNTAVRDLAEADPGRPEAGTTLSAAVFDGPVGRIVHIGDSRAYLFSAGRVVRLTRDHTLLAEMIEQARIARERADRYPLRHMLSRWLGGDVAAEPDVGPVRLGPGDWLALATDGLTDVLSDEQLGRIIARGGWSGSAELCRGVMAEALAHSPRDDLSLVVVRLADPGNGGERERS